MKDLKRFVDRNIAPLLLLCFCGIMAAFLSVRTNSFFSVKNAVNILEANSYRMLLAVGMMCIISSGAIDLSVGSMLSFSAICMAKALKAELPVGLCVGVALLMGASMGALNGVLMHVTRINAFIITLATSYMYRGLSLIATQGIPITKLPQAFRDFGCGDIFGMESGVTMALMAVIALIPIFYFMRWGSYVMSLGSNPEALKRSGVKIWKYRVSAFALMGLLSSVAGVIVTARLNSAEANAGLMRRYNGRHRPARRQGKPSRYGHRGDTAGADTQRPYGDERIVILPAVRDRRAAAYSGGDGGASGTQEPHRIITIWAYKG